MHFIAFEQHVVLLGRQVHETALAYAMIYIDHGKTIAPITQHIILLDKAGVDILCLLVAD